MSRAHKATLAGTASRAGGHSKSSWRQIAYMSCNRENEVNLNLKGEKGSTTSRRGSETFQQNNSNPTLAASQADVLACLSGKTS